MNSFSILYYWLIFLTTHAPDIVNMDNGNVAVPGQFKYFVSIWHEPGYLCGGVIIDERHILTVGHCVYGIPLSNLWILAGNTKLSDPNIIMLKIIGIWFHPRSKQVIDFLEPNRVYWTDDIAMMKVSDDFHWSSTVERIRMLRNVDDWTTDEACMIPKWQNTVTDGQRDTYLKWTFGKVLTKEEYFRLNKNSLPNTKFISVPVLFNEDSGSPLICGDIMTGLIVQGGKTIDEPSTVLEILPYHEFITAVITNGEDNSKPDKFASVISFWYKSRLICGGVIVDSTRILIASHCIPHRYKINLMKISYIHESQASRTIKFVDVSKVERHRESIILQEDCDQCFSVNQHDIAMIWLSEPFIWSASLQPAIFANDEHTSSLYCHTFRWQPRMPLSSPESDELMWFSVVIIDTAYLKKMSLLPNQFVVADGDSLGSSSSGEHGYPVVCNGIVVGIVVSSLANTGDWTFKPIIVLDIIPYIEFIRKHQ